MKFSYNWLQDYFDQALPSPAEVAETFTFHSSEVEEIVTVGDDTVFDIKILPDKSAWLMSHRGLAREFSQIAPFRFLMRNDRLADVVSLGEPCAEVRVVLDTPVCDFYGAALIRGVKVGPSPIWLKTWLEAIGQRSINNIVDATNYVMFNLGQPLHAFDAETFVPDVEGVREVRVRAATAGETVTTLSHESLTLTPDDTVITDGISGTPLALAGVKGGINSGVTAATTTILLEAAHFERVATRLSARRHKQTTDAAKRYENGLSRSVAPYGLIEGATLIASIAGGTVVGYTAAGSSIVNRAPVTVSVADINNVLGLTLDSERVASILERFAFAVTQNGDMFTVTPTHERDDIQIKQDLIEEVGRVYGLTHIVSIPPEKTAVAAINTRHYYAEVIRRILVERGFSEVYTSSFRDQDRVRIKNALASDKSYLRSNLRDNLLEARAKNIPHRDVLGLTAVQLFEIGTVFDEQTEAFHVGIAVQSGTEYKQKLDDPLVVAATAALESALQVSLVPVHTAPGYVEFSLEALLAVLPQPTAYQPLLPRVPTLYQSFSVYPSVSRDIAMWVATDSTIESVEAALRAAAGSLLVRITHLDTFTKDGRTSLAFRLVFQSNEKTLDGAEVDALMEAVTSAVAGRGWEVR
jgi:phenylalanyl-tRNA synthetase beta chain